MFSRVCETNSKYSALHDSDNENQLEDNDSMPKEDEISPSSQDQDY